MKKVQSENDIIFLKQLIADNERVLQNAVYENIDFIKKVVASEKYAPIGIKAAETQKTIGTINPEVIIKTVNRLDKNYYDEFKNKYSKLEHIEILICFMLLLEFENNGIAVLLNLSINTIQQKEVEIRKKLGAKPRGNIKLFIEENFRPLPNLPMPKETTT